MSHILADRASQRRRLVGGIEFEKVVTGPIGPVVKGPIGPVVNGPIWPVVNLVTGCPGRIAIGANILHRLILSSTTTLPSGRKRQTCACADSGMTLPASSMPPTAWANLGRGRTRSADLMGMRWCDACSVKSSVVRPTDTRREASGRGDRSFDSGAPSPRPRSCRLGCDGGRFSRLCRVGERGHAIYPAIQNLRGELLNSRRSRGNAHRGFG